MLTLSEGHCEGKSGAMVSIVEDMENPLMDLKKEVICSELMKLVIFDVSLLTIPFPIQCNLD